MFWVEFIDLQNNFLLQVMENNFVAITDLKKIKSCNLLDVYLSNIFSYSNLIY